MCRSDNLPVTNLRLVGSKAMQVNGPSLSVENWMCFAPVRKSQRQTIESSPPVSNWAISQKLWQWSGVGIKYWTGICIVRDLCADWML